MKAVLLLALLAVANAAPIVQETYVRAPLVEEGDIIPGLYVIRARAGADVTVVKALADSVKARDFWNIEGEFVGFGGEFSDAIIESLRLRTDVIEVVERSQVFRTTARQNNPPSWGLGALSSPSAQDPGYFDFPDHSGAGVTIYVIDTGIRCTHNDFSGRCEWGARFGSGGYEDGNGHGTHCASTAGGVSYGVAKNSSLVAVGVLGPLGSGSTNDVISGVNFAADDCSGNCVGSMSLGGGASSSLDNAVNAFVTSSRFMAVAAGNSNNDAGNTSPARAAEAYTVMSTDSAARKSSFSSYGSVCDIWAPGSSITAAWSTSDSATNTISGTSMACPHVAGAGALAFASGEGNVRSYIDDTGVTGAISGVPGGTVNLFLQVDENF